VTEADAPPPSSFASLLEAEWAVIVAELVAIVGASTIRPTTFNEPGGGLVFIGFPDRCWGEDPPALVQRRHDLLVTFERWRARFGLLFTADIPENTTATATVDDFVRSWLRREDNDFTIPDTIAEAQGLAWERCSAIDALLLQVAPTPESVPFVVVDTNALLNCPDLATHGGLFPGSRATIVFVPGVLAELDDLKDRGRTPDVREKATKVIKRIKGLRDRGSLAAGVVVEGHVKAQVIAVEPDFSTLPPWLDPDVPDDRIIGAVLALQAAHPSSPVVVITGDMNMANKADYAAIPTVDPPQTAP
jgi:hypothetical protein